MTISKPREHGWHSITIEPTPEQLRIMQKTSAALEIYIRPHGDNFIVAGPAILKPVALSDHITKEKSP